MFLNNKFIAGVAVATALAAGSAHATTIYPVSATASSSYSGYEALYAIDQGAGSNNTDWASNGDGNSSYLQLDLGAAYSLANAYVTDRVTSGSTNGDNVLGSFDFTTSFSLQAFTDSSFSTPLGSAVIVGGLSPPPTGVPTVVALGGLGQPAQYILYSVISADGVNPGLADIHFSTTPLPATFPLFAGGLGLIGLVARRKKLKKSAAITA